MSTLSRIKLMNCSYLVNRYESRRSHTRLVGKLF